MTTPGNRSVTGQALFRRAIVHVADIATDPAYSEYAVPETITVAKSRTAVGVPLLREGEPIGVLGLARQRVEPFSDKQIALLQNFAAQAVIAMENARLLTETREALEQQTATAEVLQVINASPGDLAPVFDAILEKAHDLCGATHGAIGTFDSDYYFRNIGARGYPEPLTERLRQGFPGLTNPVTRPLIDGGAFVHVADLAEIDHPIPQAAAKLGGFHTGLFIPLRKDDALLGMFAAARKEVRLFTDKQIALLQSFAAQAVIARENARLITELQQRTGDLQESLEYQTATSDVLKVISRSTFDLQPVLETVAETAARLCGANMAQITSREGEIYRVVASVGYSPEYSAFLETHPVITLGRGTLTGRVVLEG